MRIFKYSVRSFIVLFNCFTVWYHLPIEFTQQYQAATFEGDETTTIELRVKKYRKFFKATVIKGELIHNGKVFISDSIRSNNSANSWLTNFREKLDGQVKSTVFRYENSQISFPEWEKWIIWPPTKDDLQKLNLSHSIEGKEGKVYLYLAPASNSKEAQKILKDIMNNN